MTHDPRNDPSAEAIRFYATRAEELQEKLDLAIEALKKFADDGYYVTENGLVWEIWIGKKHCFRHPWDVAQSILDKLQEE